MSDYIRKEREFNLDLTCPECGREVRAQLEAGPIYRTTLFDNEAYLICRCPRTSCAIIFVVYGLLNDRVKRVFPFPRCSPSDFHHSIPEPVRADYAEANRCFFGRSNKGVVVLCRRAMQQIAEEKGAEGSRLIDQIDALFNKGLITKSLKDSAHEIRHFGNFGAHPRDDGLDEIGAEEARGVMRLTREFMVDLYVRPYETSELVKKREEAKKAGNDT